VIARPAPYLRRTLFETSLPYDIAPVDLFDDFLRAERRRAKDNINAKFKTLEALSEGVTSLSPLGRSRFQAVEGRSCLSLLGRRTVRY
jgi:hypothetical protein